MTIAPGQSYTTRYTDQAGTVLTHTRTIRAVDGPFVLLDAELRSEDGRVVERWSGVRHTVPGIEAWIAATRLARIGGRRR